MAARTLRLTVAGRRSEIARLHEQLAKFLAEASASEQTTYDVQLVTEELATNVIKYAWDDPASHIFTITVELRVSEVAISIEDDGRPFDPTRHRPTPLPDTLANAPTGGFGLQLVRSIGRRIRYRRVGELNRLELAVPIA